MEEVADLGHDRRQYSAHLGGPGRRGGGCGWPYPV